MRVALIGAGKRGKLLASTVESSGAGRLVAVWDRTPQTAEAVASQYEAKAFLTIESMVSETVPDLVIVATHPSVRQEAIRRALGGEHAFLIEKPIALDSSSLREITGMLDGRFAAVNTQYRWMPHWQRILNDISNGDLGRIQQVTSSTAVALIDQGTHLIGLALAVLDAAKVGGLARVRATAHGTVEYAGRDWPAQVSAVCTLPGLEYRIDAGDDAPRVRDETVKWHHIQTSVTGSGGQAWVSLTKGWNETLGTRTLSGPTAWPNDDTVSQGAMLRELALALTAPDLAARFPTRLESAVREMDVLFAILDAARSGREHDIEVGSPFAQ